MTLLPLLAVAAMTPVVARRQPEWALVDSAGAVSRRRRLGLHPGGFRLGPAGLAVNLVALAWLLFETVKTAGVAVAAGRAPVPGPGRPARAGP